MSKKQQVGKFVMIGFLCLIILTLLIVGVVAISKNKLTGINRALRAGREAFVEGEYKTAVLQLSKATDTLLYASDAAELNTAHALFLLAKSGSDAKKLTVDQLLNDKPDSLNKGDGKQDTTRGATPMDHYTELAAVGKDNNIASIAYNQLGIINYRGFEFRVDLMSDRTTQWDETTLQTSADYFKEALRKDPQNETARFNYEMVKKRMAYPELIMARVRALVKENRYTEAHKVLSDAMKTDPSIEKKSPGFLKRLEDIIKIDSHE